MEKKDDTCAMNLLRTLEPSVHVHTHEDVRSTQTNCATEKCACDKGVCVQR